MISSFIVCLNRYRSAVVRDLESNDSLFVSQMYQDRKFGLLARNLIFFTTVLQNVDYYSTKNQC